MNKKYTISIISILVIIGLLITTYTFLNSINPTKNSTSYAIIQTNIGNITILLFTDTAPLATQRFIELAENNYYNGTIIYRIFPDYAIYGGQYLMNSTLKPYPYTLLPIETSPKVRHTPGAVSLLRSAEDPTKVGCQFLICLNNITSLDGKNTILGTVIQGYDLVQNISEYPHDDQYEDGSGRILNPFDVWIEKIIIQTTLEPLK